MSSGRIRVAFYTDSGTVGGAELVLATLIEHLSDEFEAVVVGVNPLVLEAVAGARRVRADLLPPVRAPWVARAIAVHLSYLRKLRPAVFHAQGSSPWACEYGILAALATPNVRVVSVVQAASPAHRWRERVLVRLLSSRISAHVAPAGRPAREVEVMRGLRPGSMTVIPNGAEDIETVPAPRPAAGPLIGWMGRLAREKGVDVLLAALRELPDVTALLVGDGPERPRLEALAVELGVERRVVFAGWDDEPRRFLHALDVFVMPSRIEAFGLAAAEAMLAGLPVVATDVGGLAELVVPGETGILIRPDAPHELAAAVAHLLGDENERRTLGRRGRARALECFSADAMTKRYENLYKELLAA
jgi:glycosyltransferase involved in cell wall biosynthesis